MFRQVDQVGRSGGESGAEMHIRPPRHTWSGPTALGLSGTSAVPPVLSVVPPAVVAAS